jgi:hypothetical protein
MTRAIRKSAGEAKASGSYCLRLSGKAASRIGCRPSQVYDDMAA